MIKFYDLQKITSLHGDEYKAVANRVIDSGWFLQGKETEAFEETYASYIGTRHCIAVANGLDALRLIIRGYKEMGDFCDGDEVIVPANTYIATIIAISDNNLVPVLVEPTWEHLEIDIDSIEKAITPRTKAIMIVHLYGRSAYDERLKMICQQHNLKLLEDCAQSHGAYATQKRRSGSVSDAAAHSFYPGKNLGAMGDAGAVTTNDNELADVIRALANYGSQKKYFFKYKGINSRMSEMDAALLSVKLKYLDQDNAKRKKLAAYYYDNISTSDPNGVGSSVATYLDRTIAHELVHAAMSANINYFNNFPVLFKEGTAELIHGIDDKRENTCSRTLHTDESSSD